MKTKRGLIAAIIGVGVVALLLIQHQTRTKLREENQSLQERVGQLSNLIVVAEGSETLQTKRWPISRLPAPPIQVAALPVESSLQDSQSNSVSDRLSRRDAFPPKVRTEQVAAYLKESQRSAASLLASSRVTGDQRLLQEAMEKYPHDPQVNFAAVFRKDASPEERRQSLEAFKQSAPDNTLANYLSAHELFKSGQIDQAVQELSAASSKQQFQDYFMDFSQNEEEAWSAAGYSTAEAKVFSAWSLRYPHLGALEQLSRDMVSLADSYRQFGDEASAQTALQIAVNLGQCLDRSAGQPLPSRSVSIAIENNVLEALDPTTPYGGAGQTVKDRLNELSQQREVVEQLEQRGDAIGFSGRVSDPDWIIYKDRWRAFGEEAALQWLIGKYGQK